jgi:hypothetical protein
VVALGEKKKYSEAMALLNTLKGQLTAGLAKGADFGQLGAHVERLRTAAAHGLGQLEAKLRELKEAKATEVAEILKHLAAGFPTDLEAKLQELDGAEGEQAKTLKGQVNTAAQQWLAYLGKHAANIKACEASNPFKVAVAIDAPIRDSLKAILKQTAV